MENTYSIIIFDLLVNAGHVVRYVWNVPLGFHNSFYCGCKSYPAVINAFVLIHSIFRLSIAVVPFLPCSLFCFCLKLLCFSFVWYPLFSFRGFFAWLRLGLLSFRFGLRPYPSSRLESGSLSGVDSGWRSACFVVLFVFLCVGYFCIFLYMFVCFCSI